MPGTGGSYVPYRPGEGRAVTAGPAQARFVVGLLLNGLDDLPPTRQPLPPGLAPVTARPALGRREDVAARGQSAEAFVGYGRPGLGRAHRLGPRQVRGPRLQEGGGQRLLFGVARRQGKAGDDARRAD